MTITVHQSETYARPARDSRGTKARADVLNKGGDIGPDPLRLMLPDNGGNRLPHFHP